LKRKVEEGGSTAPQLWFLTLRFKNIFSQLAGLCSSLLATEQSGMSNIFKRVNHSKERQRERERERETLLEGSSSDEVKKHVTTGLRMSVSVTTERPACSKELFKFNY
jgi:hypothetical protein